MKTERVVQAARSVTACGLAGVLTLGAVQGCAGPVRFARAVDVEGVVQETLMRMWLHARDRGRELEGENASLRFAVGVARNVARSEARRLRREVHLSSGELPEPARTIVPVALAMASSEAAVRSVVRRLEA